MPKKLQKQPTETTKSRKSKPAKPAKPAATAGPQLDKKTKSALKDVAARTVARDLGLQKEIARMGGITKKEAEAVFNFYSQKKLLKVGGIDNISVKSGNLLDRATIRQALSMAGQAPKPAKPAKPRAAKPAGGRQSTKVDLTDAGFTRRLSRAKSKLKQAESEFQARGSSIYDTKARKRVSILRSAVDALSFARKTVRNNTVSANKIKTTDQTIIQNYNNQLAAVKRKSASTPTGTRGSTAPKLTRSEKAAATRAKNKAAREAEQRKRWERSRR